MSGERLARGIAEIRLQGGAAGECMTEVERALESLPEAGVLVLRCSFDPSELIPSREAAGHEAEALDWGRARWCLLVRAPGAPCMADYRDLEAPEPMEQILLGCADLEPGDALLARTPRYPRMLMPHLEERGLEWEAIEEPDESALVWVRRPR